MALFSVNESDHAKTGLKTLVVVIPREDMANTSPAKSSFGMTLTIEFYSVAFTDYISQSSYQ